MKAHMLTLERADVSLDSLVIGGYRLDLHILHVQSVRMKYHALRAFSLNLSVLRS